MRATRPRRNSWLTVINPLTWLVYWADWFESRGVYVSGEDNRNLSPWRDFGWLIAGWMATVGVLVLLLAVAT
ncbi:MAG TPA: hypothetical protein VG756_08810 [Pseudonocardiaceae bacterium]|jgi:hypothetical protein|nr:hypothetical protein [Pseudonocardiaceae bacterium]